MNHSVHSTHPRAESIRIREMLLRYFRQGVVAEAGLIAHGRGEAFDYLLGERTTGNAMRAIEAAAATLLSAKKPVISVNGNAAALTAESIVQLARVVGARIEVNLYYRSAAREDSIQLLLKSIGAEQVLGVREAASARIPEIGSDRRRVDPQGIEIADVVLVPLEDGDRTEALVKLGKLVIAVDLNPLSRTAQTATITIVDNIVRALPVLVKTAEHLKTRTREELETITSHFDNQSNLNENIMAIHERLTHLADKQSSGTGPVHTSPSEAQPRTNLNELWRMKNVHKIIMLTAYDYQLAKILDQEDVDLILVGDSLGMVFQGHNNTKEVTMHQMLYHTRAVAAGVTTTPIIADMPLNSDRTEQEAIENARMLLNAGANGVKIEGNKTATIRALLDQKIPVMGHIGLLPQTAERYKVRGTTSVEAEEIMKDALALDAVGVFAIVLESIPEKLSKRITESVRVPTIGIGAGKYCDGQVIVTHDILGLPQTHTPKYVKKYADCGAVLKAAISKFKLEVANGSYPDDEHTYH